MATSTGVEPSDVTTQEDVPTAQSEQEVEKTEDRIQDYRIDFSRLLYMHHLSTDYAIRQADMKAQVIFGVSTVVITALGNTSVGDFGLIFDATANLILRIELAIRLLVMLLLLTSVFLSILVVLPRFKESTSGSSLYYFNDIIKQDEDAYIERYNSMTTYEIKNAVISQIHAKSFIVDAKFRGVRYSFIVAMVAAVLWGVQYVLPA